MPNTPFSSIPSPLSSSIFSLSSPVKMKSFALLYLAISFSFVSVVWGSKSMERWHVPVRGGASSSSSSPSLSSSRKSSLPHYYDNRDDDYNDFDSKNTIYGRGREFEFFSGNLRKHTNDVSSSPRGGSTADTNIDTDNLASSSRFSSASFPYGRAGGRSSTGRRKYRRRSSRGGSTSAQASGSSSSSSAKQSQTHFRNPLSSMKSWLSENQSSIPRIQVKVEPNTTLKLRKRFRPLFKTVVTLGADFNNRLGVWQFKSSWEDSIIGGRLMLSGRELQLSKTWLLSVGAVEDLVTRLRFRAAIDLGTGKAYARFGFRTERLSPINVVEGFTLLRQLPLDGPDGHVKLEVKANFAFPEPEIEYSTEKGGRSLIGMGDIEVNLDELNLLLDY